MLKLSNYSYIYKKDDSVNTEDLSSEMDILLSSLEEVGSEIIKEDESFGGFVITSAKDSHFGKNSYHNFGKAIDLSLYDSNRNSILGWSSGNWSTFKSVMSKANSKDTYFWYLLEGRTDIQLEKILNGRTDINSKATGAELHYHVEFNPGKAKQLPGINLPDKLVDKIDNRPPELPMVFIYQEKEYIKFKDLLLSNPLFKNYLTKENSLDKEKSLNLLKYAGDTKVSNYERILNRLFCDGLYNVISGDFGTGFNWMLTEDEFKSLFPEPLDIPVCDGQDILLPPSEAQRDFVGLQSEGQVFYFDDFSTFISKTRREIETSKDYVPTEKLFDKIGDYSLGNQVNNINSYFSVWIYCKKLGQIVDISKYCKYINSSSEDFTIGLSYLDKNSLTKLQNESYSSEYKVILSSGFSSNGSSTTSRTKPSLFHEIISQGDIIFIRYETLELEENTDSSKCELNEQGLPIITKDMLPGNCYDLIGLVDSCSQSEEFVLDNFLVTISGTSLSGIFEKDISLFLPIAIIANNTQGNLVFGSANKDGLMKRLFVDGSYGYLWNYQSRTIEDTVKFYLNQLTNSAVITEEEDIFAGYPEEKKTKVFELLPKKSVLVSSSNGETVKYEYPRELQKVNASGIYQIIKVDIDESLKNRMIADSSASNPEGSINSLFQRLCRFPLVEYFTDTYGDTFHIVIRKPPFDQKSILDYMDYMYEINPETNDSNKVEKFVSITADEVDSEQLDWNTDFYTWFQMSSCSIITDTQSLYSFLPIVYLQEYVYRWGSRPLQYSNPYLKRSEESSTLFDEKDRAQIISDMIYLLESNIYLPFTRRGTIVLKKGERRIKKGTWIKYEKTNEVYYVDSVVQNASISESSVNRTTILSVSRGMVFDFLKEKKVQDVQETISYFKLLDFESLKKELKDYADGTKKKLEIKRDLKINKTVFDFFLKRKQFE